MALREAATGLGLAGTTEAWAGPPPLRQGTGNGQTVAVLGAGVGGLTACYELVKAGYQCVVLEAQNRAGGRSLTARPGDIVVERATDGSLVEQECRFDEGLYVNLGPGRIPHHHRRVIHYCRELEVALEPYIMHTTANLFQRDGAFASQALTCRQIAHDTRGRLAELLATVLERGDLDADLAPDERVQLESLLRTFGVLTDGRYPGSDRAGCLPGTPDVHDPCEPEKPLLLSELLAAEFWLHRFYQPDDYLWQPTLFQPVGGMDRIVDGLLRGIQRLDGRPIDEIVRRQQVVTGIGLRDDGVEVQFRGAGGATDSLQVDYCVSNIPLPLLAEIPANFSREFRDAVESLQFEPAFKVAWQANRRFWEEDYQIYGGISWIDHPITQMWYPSNDYFTDRGTLTGAYTYEDRATRFGEMAPAERLRIARQGGARLHREFLDDTIVPQRLGMSVAWQNMPYQAGGWGHWQDTPQERTAYSRLLSPDRERFFVVGDQVSRLPGWQEGAMTSAQHVVEQIGGVRSTEMRPVEHTPVTAVVVGSEAAA